MTKKMKKVKKIVSMVLCMVITFVGVAMGYSAKTEAADYKYQYSKMTIPVGGTFHNSLIKGTGVHSKYASIEEKDAVFSKIGIIKYSDSIYDYVAVKEGTVKVTNTYHGKKYSFTVKVVKPYKINIKSVKYDKKKKQISFIVHNNMSGKLKLAGKMYGVWFYENGGASDFKNQNGKDVAIKAKSGKKVTIVPKDKKFPFKPLGFFISMEYQGVKFCYEVYGKKVEYYKYGWSIIKKNGDIKFID